MGDFTPINSQKQATAHQVRHRRKRGAVTGSQLSER
jgi:hypothetical protein